jgi:1-phosphofructokinase
VIKVISLNPTIDRTLTVGRLVYTDINRVISARTDPGGKAVNVCRFLRILGEKAVLFGFAGGLSGSLLRKLLDGEGIEHDFTGVAGETRTIINIVETLKRREIRINEAGPRVSGRELQEFLNRLYGNLEPDDILVMSGSIPPGIPSNFFRRIIRKAKAAGIKTFVDSDGEPLRSGTEAGPFLIKPNCFELQRLIGDNIRRQTDVVNAALKLRMGGVSIVAVSNGGKPAVCISENGAWAAVPPQVEVRSTIGAGDAFLAGMISGLETGKTIPESLRLAVAAGSAKVQTEGTGLCNLKQIRQLLPLVRVTAVG